MDKSGRGVCLRNEKGTCVMGAHCPLRHIVGDKVIYKFFFPNSFVILQISLEIYLGSCL